MAIKTEDRGVFTIVHAPSGRLKNQEAGEIQAAGDEVLAKGRSNIVLDFSSATQLNSMLLGVVVDLCRKASGNNGSLGVVLKGQDIEETFLLSGLQMLVKVYHDIEEIPSEAGDPEESMPRSPILEVATRGTYKILRFKKDDPNLVDAARELRSAVDDLLKQGYARFVFDLSGMRLIDSVLITCIADCRKQVQDRQGDVFVLAGNAEVRETLETLGLSEVIRVFDSHEELEVAIRNQGAGTRQRLVLIVDDSSTMREMLKKRVSHLGHSSIMATNGREAVDLAVVGKPDLILMDIEMPEMNGLEACREIKNRCDRHIPIIFVTSLNEPEKRLEALKAGGDDFVTKPVQAEDLIFRLGAHLRISELTEELRIMNEGLEKRIADRTQELVETERQLHQAEKLSTLGTMLSGIAHELRNPLSAVSGWAEMLAHRGEDEKVRSKATDNITKSVVRCSAVVDNLLKLARKKVGKVELINLNQVITDVQGSFQYLSGKKTIEIRTQLSSQGLVRGNAAEIEQIVVNLVSNAVDAIEDKGVVTISTSDSVENCMLSVEDTGSGITDEVRKKIFDPFFTTKDPGKGTGLGMSIVHKIIQVHQGRVSVESEVGRGTSFTILLPRMGSDPAQNGSQTSGSLSAGDGQ